MPKLHSILLAILTAATMLLAMAHYRNQSYPAVIVLDPRDGHIEVARALRSEEEVTLLFKSGFLAAVRIATGSWPYPVEPGQHRIRTDLAVQYFQDGLLRLVQEARALYGVRSPHGVPTIVVAMEAISVLPRDGGFLIDAHLTQHIPAGNRDRLRLLHVQGFGFLCPVTADNPTNIRFSKFRITEVQPQKEITP